MIVSKANSYLYINLNPSAMKNQQLPLTLQHARHITNGHYELNRLVAHFYLFGGEQYTDMESPKMTAQFLDMAPCTGDALYQLYKQSERPFELFVADVISGMYFWHAVGRSVGSFAGIQLQLARIALRHSVQLVSAIFSPPINSE